MTSNRLSRLRYVSAVLLALQCTFFALPSQAQTSFFNFTPPQPDTAHVNADCWRTINDFTTKKPPIVTSTQPGVSIIMSMFNAVKNSPFYGFNDMIPPGGNPVVVEWFVKDDLGRTAFFEFTITFVDATKPVFDLTNHPSVLNLNSVVLLPPVVNPPVTDNCPPPPNITVTFEQSPNLPDTCQSGTVTRTWRATDGGGNTAVFTQTINIFKDSLPPVISTFPQNGSAPCAQLATAYPNWLSTQMANFKATDPSGIKTYTNNAPPNYPTGCVNSITVTFRAIDNCDLIFPTTATFSTSDTRPPTVTKAARDTQSYCAASPNAFLPDLSKWINKRAYSAAFDSCSADNLLQYRMRIGGIQVDSAQVVAALQASLSGSCGTQINGGKTYDRVRGFVKVEFLVKDACNNEISMGEPTFIVRDTLPPVIMGKDTTQECGGGDDQAALESWINAKANASINDDCSPATWSNFSWTTSTGVTGNGNFSTGPFPIVHANNCNWNVIVTFRATDQCGNTGSKGLKFQLTDKTKPVFAPLPTVTVYCPQVEPANPKATATDNCDSLLNYTFVKQKINGSCTGNYNIKITFTATDDCGNSATAEQIYQIRDTLPPVFTSVPAAKTFQCDTFVLPDTVKLGVNIFATDLCSPVTSVKTSVNSGKNPNPALCGHYQYNITRTFTARDECGNTATATQVLQIIDTQGPILKGWADTTASCSNIPNFPPPLGTDACGSPVSVAVKLNEIKTTLDCVDKYTLTSSWQAKDACNNLSPVFIREIAVSDTTRPQIITEVPADISVECDAIPAPPALNSFSLLDNCDTDVSISFAQSELRNPDVFACDHWANYVLRREWTVTDNCGNTRKYTQNIQIEDNTGPVLTARAPFNLPNAMGLCGLNMIVPPPLSLYDVCNSVQSAKMLSDSAVLKNTSGLPNLQTGVDTITFQWASPNLPPAVPVVGPAQLKITLKNADSDGPLEYLNIWGENNTLLGRSKRSPTQCSSSDTTVNIPANLLNAWLTDGQLQIKLTKNGAFPPSNEINVVTCPGGQPGRAFAELKYNIATQQTAIAVTYKVDNMATQNYPPSGSILLEVGQHTVLYTATDCAGNSSTATTTITVQDVQAPSISVPGTPTYYTGPNNCESEVSLPFPNITENCAMSGVFSQTSAPVPVEFHTVADVGIIPKDLVRVFNSLTPNAVGVGQLRIRFKGDNATLGEFFIVYDENNVEIGKTLPYGPNNKECKDFHEIPINVTAAQINNWAKDGAATFKLVANDENSFDFINPCGPLTNGSSGFDGISEVVWVLEYTYAVIDYTLRNSAGVILENNKPLIGNDTKKTLPPGNYSVEYRSPDTYGLVGIGKFNLSVRDTVRPKAFCKQSIINTNPSGQIHIITKDSINAGSTDNCSSNLNFSLSHTQFSCLDIPQNPITVTLTVTDTSGNSATCTTLVRIETEKPKPSFIPVCEGGTLELFANPPAGSVPYTFKWEGPNEYNSNDRDPKINGATKAMRDGTYTVTVTGVPGCTAVGVVTVALIAPPSKPLIKVDSTDRSYCLGSDVVLTASGTASNATFEWYELEGFPKLLGTTNAVATFHVPAPTVGTHRYYVRATGNGCTSQNSDLITINVLPVPVAVVDDDYIDVCEGANIFFAPKSVDGGAVYKWEGPGLSPNQSGPTRNLSADTIYDDARYLMTVIKDGCASVPDTVLVNIRPKPAKPILENNTNLTACAGDAVKLICTTPATQYNWTKNNAPVATTSSNFLNLNNVSSAQHNGAWRVVVLEQGCLSDASSAVQISVGTYPVVSAVPSIGVCAADTLFINPTANQAVSWEWRGPDNFNRFQRDIELVPPVLPGEYIVFVQNNFGCRDTASVMVSVYPQPVAIATHESPTCFTGTQNIRLIATVTGGSWPFIYTWTGPNMFNINNSTDSVAIVPSATAINAGAYNLTVKDKHNCVSQAVTTTVVATDRPKTPVLDNVAPACTGQKVILKVNNANQYSGMNVQYCWNTPVLGVVTTTVPEYEIAALNAQFKGQYTVIVKVDGCDSEVSASVLVVEKPIPPTPLTLPSKDTMICSGEMLELRVKNAFQGATYQWIGPLSITGETLKINAVDMSHSGIYKVGGAKDGCASPLSEGIKVTVLEKPGKPFAIAATPLVCIGQNVPMRLEADVNSLTNGAQYQWFKANSNLPIAPPRDSAVFKSTNFNGILVPGENKFYLKAYKNGCVSELSQTVSIWADTIPNITAFAGNDFFSCDTMPFQLKALKPSVGDGRWDLLMGSTVTIADPIKDTTTVLKPFGGNVYTFTWTLSAGACTNYSRDTVKVSASTREIAQSKPVVRVCPSTFGYEINLMATQGNKVQGYWTQPQQQADLGLLITDPLETGTTVERAGGGQLYYFFWNLAVPGCPISTSTTEVYTYSVRPHLGDDQRFCTVENKVALTAPPISGFEMGAWKSPDPALSFQPNNNPNTVLSGLSALLPNVVIWETNGGVCGDNSRDTLVINYGQTPVANRDSITTVYGTPVNINIIANDIMLPVVAPTILSQPLRGKVETTGTLGTVRYLPKSGFYGFDEFVYNICNTGCVPSACATTTVVVNVLQRPDACEVPTVITPNGDGVNDVFRVICPIGEGQPKATLTVFNQWGDEVYFSNDYQNDWDGSYKGNQLPVGTYYVVYDVGDGRPLHKGFLIIER